MLHGHSELVSQPKSVLPIFFMFLKILGIFDQSCFISVVADTEFGPVYTVKKYKKMGGHHYGGNNGYYTRFWYKY